MLKASPYKEKCSRVGRPHFYNFWQPVFAISCIWIDGFWWNKCLYLLFRTFWFQRYLDHWATLFLSALDKAPKSALWKLGIAKETGIFTSRLVSTYRYQLALEIKTPVSFEIYKSLGLVVLPHRGLWYIWLIWKTLDRLWRVLPSHVLCTSVV